MKIFLNYLKDYKIPASLLVLFGFINILLGFLYQTPLEQSLLWLIICGFIAAIAVSFHFYKYYRHHHDLAMLQQDTQFKLDRLPVSNNLRTTDYQDILRQLTDDLSRLENEKIQSEEELLDYFTMWVHQIKVPISALYLIIQDEDSDISEEMAEQLFKIEQYVDMILQYMRLESPATDYQFNNVDVDTLVRETLKKYAAIFIRKKLPVDFTPTNLQLITDSKWLSFVLEQILSNALKYTEAGTISIYLDEMSLVIQDTGIGIRPEDIPRVGERNFTGFTGRAHKSASGIGLYLSKQILKELGYKLEIDSEIGTGTTVKIVFEA